MNMISTPENLGLIQGTPVTSLIVIDSAVPDKHVFYAQQKPGVEIVEIPADVDGLAALDDLLSGYRNLQSLHVVSHGLEGALTLGNTVVDAETLQANSDVLNNLDAALIDGGDVLLYGCDVGAGDDGQALLQLISDGASVDVAASDDLTGSADAGGDWELEIQTGNIEATSFSAASMADFSGTLAIPGTIAFGSAYVAGSLAGPASVNAAYRDNGYTLVGDGAAASTYIDFGRLYSSYGETSLTLSFSGGLEFDATSFYLYNISGDDTTFTIASSSTGNITTGIIGDTTGETIDLAAAGGFTDITSIVITANGGYGSGTYVGIDDLVIANIGATNTAPVFSNLDGGETHVEASGVTRLDHNVLIADAELDALNTGNGDYNGASITIARNGGANADDEFGGFGQLGALIQGNTFQYSSSTVGTVTTNSGGTLVLTFNSTVTSAIADQILRSIAYSNSNSSPPASVTLDWTFNDGTSDSTGTNQTTVNITDVTAATSFAAAFDTTDGTNLTPGITFGTGDETLTIADAAHIAGSTINGGGGTDTLELPDTADISSVSVTGFESLTLASGASVTMTEAQHDAFSTISGAGTEQITISAATDGLTGDADIETYVLGVANSFALGAAAQNVTGSSGNDTISVGGLTASGTLNGAGGTDTLIIGNGGNIADASVSGIETLTVSSGASVTMTEAQHDAFSTINGAGTNQITISAATDGLTGSAAIETYVLGAANSFTLGAAAQNVTGSSGNDTVNIGTLTATGTLNAAGGTDTLEMSSGANISGASVSSFENLTLGSGASVTVDAFQLAQFSGTITAAGTETVNVIGDGDFTTLANVESFVVGDEATNSRTVTVASASTDVTASELTDAVTFNLGSLTYTGTLTGDGAVNDTVSLGDGASIASATLNNIENLTLASGGSFTMNVSQVGAFTGTITAAGSESVAIVGDGNFATLANVESFNVDDDSTNTRTVTVTSANTDVTATSGSDAVTFNLGG